MSSLESFFAHTLPTILGDLPKPSLHVNPTHSSQSLYNRDKPTITMMMRITSLLLLSPLLASAFTAPHYHRSPRTVLQVAAESETGNDINLILNGNNIELTPALNDYVEKRIGSPLRKLGGGGIVREVDVHLSVYKNPKVCFDFCSGRRTWESLSGWPRSPSTAWCRHQVSTV